MLFSLVKKDFLLVKNYIAIMSIAAFGFPIFLSTRLNTSNGRFVVFFLTTLMIQYILFNSVSMAEYKCKGAVLLCTTPYTRNALVKSEYLFNLITFICCCIIYTAAALLFPSILSMLSISAFGLSLLAAAVIFGVIIPVQHQFGYEKSKYIITFIIFITPFTVPSILNLLKANNIGLHIFLPLPPVIQGLFPILSALIISFISMFLTINIYSKKDL